MDIGEYFECKGNRYRGMGGGVRGRNILLGHVYLVWDVFKFLEGNSKKQRFSREEKRGQVSEEQRKRRV